MKANPNQRVKWSKLAEDFKEISYEDAKKATVDFKHAAHGFIWARNDNKLWNKFAQRAAILMQMRFDGFIGFPGGIVDGTDESWEFGLNRELDEEINLDPKHKFDISNYLFSSINQESMSILHFYGKEVSLAEFLEIEKRSLESHDYGGEVMGLFRPILYEMPNNRGVQIFMQNQFVGNALFQLLRAILHFNILDHHEIINFVNKC